MLVIAVAAMLLMPAVLAQAEGGNAQTTVAPAATTTPDTTSTSTTPDTTTPDTTTPAEDPAADDGGTETSATEGDDEHPGLGLAALLFGLLVIFALLYYLNQIQGKYYRTSESIVLLGKFVPKAVSIAAIDRDRDPLVPEIKIDGPGVVVVGEATQFKAMSDDTEQVVDWTIERADEGTEQAALDPASGSQTEVTTPATGSYKLIAKQGGVLRDEVVVSAIVPETAEQDGGKTVELPFVGEGYGTLMIAIVILSVAAALGFAGVLGASAIATLLGAIAGYIFVKAAGGGDSSDGGTAGSPPQSGTGA